MPKAVIAAAAIGCIKKWDFSTNIFQLFKNSCISNTVLKPKTCISFNKKEVIYSERYVQQHILTLLTKVKFHCDLKLLS